MGDLIQRVPSLIEWFPVGTNTWIYSPYIILPPIFMHEDEILASCINYFVHPPNYESDPYWKTSIGQTLLSYHQHVFGEFIRGFLNKNFQSWRMPRQWQKTIKSLVTRHASLMGQIWRVIKLLPHQANPRPLILHKINLEGGLIFFDCIAEVEQQKITATNMIKTQQNINRQLQTLKNPFDRTQTPVTWDFISSCQQLANQNHDFQRDYTRLVDARMALLTTIRENHSKVFDQSGKFKEKRGRKLVTAHRNKVAVSQTEPKLESANIQAG
jgi:uncharacterized membrane-anchored protein YhcB (DUF1043 family)